ncbi:hypothetical protein [Novosphingopyxis sp.]|uniref:hypothetical protein n=1 Tax=Novosphingopyxis sp. TaxID=2709690 RepID=UPI003B5C67CF
MRELTITELEVVTGGMYMQQELPGDDGGGYYGYGQSSLTDMEDGSGVWAGTAYQADSGYLQNEAQAMSIDWKVEGQVGNGGWSVKASVGGKC